MNRPTPRAAVRIAADSRPVLVFTVVLTLAVALASFALSFASLRDAALWGRVPESLAFLVPVVIDASVLVYGLVALVLRARGRSSAWAWTLMFGFTVVSIGANAAHAYDVGPELRTIVGVVLVALAPLSVLTSTHALASLVVADGPVVEPEPVPAAEPVDVTPEPVPAALESAPVDVTPAPIPDPVPLPAEPERSPVGAAPVARRPRLGRVRPVTQDALDLPGLAVGADA
ncbi:DUF2637 domain-containing protein [Promicromonospora panici]|uniref:DUF2637 domain-containing protein n=1 Tax=Promicromonospora panici TaxID=2219658 RepID=UPI00101DA621|nr:DUF2637 domain-containing protein [Promicromonospora panici]